VKLAAIATLILIPLLLAEFGPWCGWLASKLLPFAAVLRCGRGERADIRAEEWSHHLSDIPAPISRLIYALGYLVTGSAVASRRKLRKRRFRTPGNYTLPPTVYSTEVEPNELAWQELARCAQSDPDAFFPERGGSVQKAKQICKLCQVRKDCLEYALAHDEVFGIWGGLSARERRPLHRMSGTLT
jgi:WhiB family redox-sensing transcriptional regulator